jgi:DNA-binding IclR family transcriptional regulator
MPLALTNDDVLAALAGFEATAVETGRLAAALDAPKPYVTTHLQQLALRDLVAFNTHRGVRRWRLTARARRERPARNPDRPADAGPGFEG